MGYDNRDSGDNVDKISEEDANDDNIEEVVDRDGEIIGSQKLVRIRVVSPDKNKMGGSGEQVYINNNIPNDWTFPGFMCFVLYVPFADKNNRLPIFDINDASRGVASITKKRKEGLITKCNDCCNDSTNDRGFTTDQRISIEVLRVQKMSHVHNDNESNMILLIGHEAAISKQIEAAENRATICCKEYDKDNCYWKRVDDLFVELKLLIVILQD